MQNELISVIMSVYNERPEWLRQSIDSILGQTYGDLELILVLDKPDNTELETILREYAATDKRVVLVKNERNRGIVYSLNRGLELVRGEYVARMDADDYCALHRLETQLRALKEEKLDFVASTMYLIDENGGSLDGPNAKLGGPGWPAEATQALFGVKNFMPHPTWLTRPEVYRAVGPYHEIPRAEDYEWLCRAALTGLRMRRLGEPLLYCRVRPDSISTNGMYEQQQVAYAIRREYKKALAEGRGMDTPALMRELEKITKRDHARDDARFERGLKLYYAALEKWDRSRAACAVSLLRAFAYCPMTLRRFLDTRQLDRIERQYPALSPEPGAGSAEA